jgi:hypothetical protein
MFVLPNVDLRHPVRLLIANVGERPITPSFRLFRTDAREVRAEGFQLSPRIGPITPNGTWLSTLTFLEVGVGNEPIDGQVQVSFDGDDARVGVQYEYDQMIRTTVRLNAARV